MGGEEKTVAEKLRRGVSGIHKVSVGGDGVFMGMVLGRERFSDENRSIEMAASALARLRDEAGKNTRKAVGSHGSVGVVVGSSKGLPERLYPGKFSRGIPDFSGDNVSRELARILGAEGPALNYPAACATGLICLIQGANLLCRGICDEVFAGATEASGYPLFLAGFKNMGALSSQPMQPFHADGNGFNPGEGAAVFRMVQSGDSAEGEKPKAILRGWDFRADAYHMTAVDPTGDTLALSIRKALQQAGWKPEDVEYINAHGTGTPVNDAVETRAIATVFGENCPPVSSLKPYIGHLLGASGAVELALVLMALRNGFVPPTLCAGEFDPKLPVRHVPPGGLEKRVRRFLKLSLGFGGHVAVLAVEIVPD